MTVTRVFFGLLASAGLQLLGAELGAAALARNCQADADCGAAPATCELLHYQTCAGKDPACPAGSACGDKPTLENQADCKPYIEGICRQPHELPCQADADCGAGFRCVEQIGMWCRGGGSSGGAGVAPSSWQECGVSRGTFACELIESSCKADRDCAAGLRCQQSAPSACDVASGTSSDDGEAALGEPARPADCTASAPKLCAPPGYFSFQSKDAEVTAHDAGGAAGAAEADEASDADAQTSVAGGAGCSLHTRPGSAGLELGWLALLGVLATCSRKRRAA
jgi:hypothetical protein